MNSLKMHDQTPPPLKITPLLQTALNRMFNMIASVVIIRGKWKTGKTNTALLLTEYLQQLGLVREVAANVHADGVQFINDMRTLQSWALKDSRNKLMLYDEAITSSPNRAAMTSLNRAWLKFIPQLSKGHVKLIVVTQGINLTDSVFSNPLFLRGVITKPSYYYRWKSVFYFPQRQEEYTIHLPATRVRYNPDEMAEFFLDPQVTREEIRLLPNELQACWYYAQEGLSFTKIQRKMQLGNVNNVRRLIQKGLTVLLQSYITSVEGTISPERNKNDSTTIHNT